LTRIPIVDFRKMDRLLASLGFSRIRQHGSHVFYRHPDGRTTTVPDHPGRDLARSLIREILREVDLTSEQFEHKLAEL
jgi:predicted RNA binding protein YcfA (HicA-like mRNA interferase family)